MSPIVIYLDGHEYDTSTCGLAHDEMFPSALIEPVLIHTSLQRRTYTIACSWVIVVCIGQPFPDNSLLYHSRHMEHSCEYHGQKHAFSKPAVLEIFSGPAYNDCVSMPMALIKLAMRFTCFTSCQKTTRGTRFHGPAARLNAEFIVS